MPRRDDIHSVLIIGAGPIIIGQACEFDYSGVQAVKALKEEGYRVILVNSNPATIMTDPGLADATYIEPITADMVTKTTKAHQRSGVVAVARPAVLPAHAATRSPASRCGGSSRSAAISVEALYPLLAIPPAARAAAGAARAHGRLVEFEEVRTKAMIFW